MTEQIKNLFKHQIPFCSLCHDMLGRVNFLQDFSMHQTILIKYPPAIDIENSGDVYDKVEPFLRHLASKHIAEKHEGYTYVGTEFDTGIRTESKEDDLHDYKLLVEVNVEPENTINGIVFKFKSLISGNSIPTASIRIR